MRKLSLLLAFSTIVSPAGATEWSNFGARAMGMGGTGVALAQGPVGAYWNPAGLGQTENPSGVQVPVGVHAALTGNVLEGANDLNQLYKNCSSGGSCTQAQIDAALTNLNNPNNGVRADLGAGVDVKIGKITFFLNNFTYIAGRPVADLVHDTPATIANNTSHLNLRGLSASELGAGYGHELPFLPGLLLGGNVKLISGRVGYYDQSVITNDSGNSGSLGNFTKNDKKSAQFGLDVGALWDMNRTFPILPMRPRIGITAHNVNNPKFEQPDAAIAAGQTQKYSLQGNSRVGVAISPLHFWNITADADLTRNITALDGVASRMVGIGTEINVFNRSWLNIPLRAGLERNTAQPSAKTQVTAGAGLNLLHFTLDLAVQVSPATQSIQTQGQDKKIPTEVGAAIQLGFLFGGAKEDLPKKDAPAKKEKGGLKPL